jgi:hypothetical protein
MFKILELFGSFHQLQTVDWELGTNIKEDPELNKNVAKHSLSNVKEKNDG